MIGLVDCNSFYASCERIFRPDLKDRPIVVLSNNDGCIVAMDRNAKKNGIRRGIPYFQVKGDLAALQAEVFSSNYTLYQDISDRIMEILRQHASRTEVYSIDEAFLFLDDNRLPLFELGNKIRRDVEQCTGVPVSIGFGRTKTLAKIANRWAKNRHEDCGIFSLEEQEESSILARINVLDIWGIGTRKAAFLFKHGIRTALDFRETPEYWVKKHLTQTTLRTLWELKGIPSIEPEMATPPKQMILSSLGFSLPVQDLATLETAVSMYASSAVKKLVKQNSEASGVMVFIRTHRHKQPYFADSRQIKLPESTAYLPEITYHALTGLREIYRTGYDYIKAGVCLYGLSPKNHYQHNLFLNTQAQKRKVTESVQEIQSRFGSHAISSGRSVSGGEWIMKQKALSPRYTTRWSDIPDVH